MLLTDEVLEDTFASFLLFRWDPSEHTVTYSNAGHCRPVVITPEKTELALHSNLILGLEANAEFDDETIALEPDSALLAYTDGLLEHPVDGQEVLGEKGILEIAAASLNTDDPIQVLLDEALSHGPTDSFHDDVLVFWMQREE